MSEITQASAAVAYLRFVMAELGLSASGLAKRAGLASTTITRALNDPEHRFELSISTLKKIAAASGISPAPFLQTRDFADLSLVPLTQPSVYDRSWGADADKPYETEGWIAIIGSAAVGVYKQPEIARIQKTPPFPIKIGEIDGSRLFALKMDDDSANRFVPAGFFALCHRVGDDNTPHHGSMVVVERKAESGHLIEISLRRLIAPDHGTPALRLDSNDPRFSEVISLAPGAEPPGKISIIGTVLYAISMARDETLLDEWKRQIDRRIREHDRQNEA